jgi:serine/threonine protein kinase
MEVASAHNKAKVTLPIGTPGYMSYEQERGQSVSNSDIYSLGMVALQALTGKHPSQFPRDRDYEINWRNYAKVTREFAAVLDRMSRCNPLDRYQTVDEVLKDLAKLPKLSTDSPRITDDRDMVKPNRLLLPFAIAFLALTSGIYLFSIGFSTGWNPFKSDILPSDSPNPSAAIPTVSPSPQTSATLVPDRKASYEQLSIYLKAKNWKAADNETYLLLLQAAGSQSVNDGTFHPDEFNRITCADLVLIDQLWTQASSGKQGLTAQKKIYEDSAKDIRKVYENIGWFTPSGELAIDTAYDRQTSRWEYIEGRQPNFKSPIVGHLPFLLREPNKNLERMVTLYRCSS